jgi:hypothetical protein
MADPSSLVQPSQASTPSLSTQATVLAVNLSRAGFIMQNQGTNPIYVAFGSGATSSVYHIVLAKSTAAGDGSGAIFSMDSGVIYTGIVTAAGTGLSYTVAEF